MPTTRFAAPMFEFAGPMSWDVEGRAASERLSRLFQIYNRQSQ
jgi:hypothetical protein